MSSHGGKFNWVNEFQSVVDTAEKLTNGKSAVDLDKEKYPKFFELMELAHKKTAKKLEECNFKATFLLALWNAKDELRKTAESKSVMVEESVHAKVETHYQSSPKSAEPSVDNSGVICQFCEVCCELTPLRGVDADVQLRDHEQSPAHKQKSSARERFALGWRKFEESGPSEIEIPKAERDVGWVEKGSSWFYYRFVVGVEMLVEVRKYQNSVEIYCDLCVEKFDSSFLRDHLTSEAHVLRFVHRTIPYFADHLFGESPRLELDEFFQSAVPEESTQIPTVISAPPPYRQTGDSSTTVAEATPTPPLPVEQLASPQDYGSCHQSSKKRRIGVAWEEGERIEVALSADHKVEKGTPVPVPIPTEKWCFTRRDAYEAADAILKSEEAAVQRRPENREQARHSNSRPMMEMLLLKQNDELKLLKENERQMKNFLQTAMQLKKVGQFANPLAAESTSSARANVTESRKEEFIPKFDSYFRENGANTSKDGHKNTAAPSGGPEFQTGSRPEVSSITALDELCQALKARRDSQVAAAETENSGHNSLQDQLAWRQFHLWQNEGVFHNVPPPNYNNYNQFGPEFDPSSSK